VTYSFNRNRIVELLDNYYDPDIRNVLRAVIFDKKLRPHEVPEKPKKPKKNTRGAR